LSLFQNNQPTGVRVNTRSGAKETPFTGPVWWLAGAVLAAALLLQTEIVHYVQWRGAQPSLVLVWVVWYAMHADWRRAAAFGLIAGACEDALSAQTGASWTISTTIVSVFAATLARWFFPDSLFIAGAVAFLCTLVRRMLFWVSMALFSDYPAGYGRLHAHEAVWAALMNAVLLAVFVLAARHIEERRSA